MGAEAQVVRGDPPQDSLRYELKLACQEAAHARVLMALRLHPLAIRTHHPTRRVQSIYFDTPSNKALEENLAGISHREKLRFRWYGEGMDAVRGRLECKVRENSLGWKHVFEVPGEVLVLGAGRREFLAELARKAPLRWRNELGAGLEAVQWISYTREYFVTADGTVRVTLDRGLESWDLRLPQRIDRTLPAHLPSILVVEAKCAPEHYETARAIVARLPLVVDRCSKFVLASRREHGPVPSLLPD